ncbi:MAG: zinc ABC transporter substrate-binding protein [Thermoanaerobaculaceae bacterium]|nr:zinc ABC transporter substrate-binding protein [Thermoanaerobaculaceae bacterium]
MAVEVLVQAGQAAESFDPTPRQLATLQESDLYITVGMPFERPLRAKLAAVAPNLKAVDGTAGLALQPMDEEGEHVGHAHGALDPHFWLDPTYMAAHARLIAAALGELDPPNAAAYTERLQVFEQQLGVLEGRVRKLLEPCRGRSILVVHPAFGYLARRYGLKQLALEREGKEPAARQLAELEIRARAAGVTAVFVQVQFPSRAAEVLADALGVPVVAVNDLSPDYDENLQRMARQFASACRGEPAGTGGDDGR